MWLRFKSVCIHLIIFLDRDHLRVVFLTRLDLEGNECHGTMYIGVSAKFEGEARKLVLCDPLHEATIV